MATIKICDRCGNQCKEWYTFMMYKGREINTNRTDIELCQDCRQEILDWIEIGLHIRLEEQAENEGRKRNLQR